MIENPYQTPQAQTLPPQHQAGKFGPIRKLSSLATFCKVMMILNIVSVLSMLAYIYTDSYKNFATATTIEKMEGGNAMQILMLASGAGIIIFILSVVAVCMWTSKAMMNTWANGKAQPQPSITPGWAAGWYFIPFANLWKPYEAMTEIWSGVFGYGKSRILLITWWLTWLVLLLLTRMSFKLEIEEVEATRNLDAASAVVTVISALCLIKIVDTVSKYYNAKAEF